MRAIDTLLIFTYCLATESCTEHINTAKNYSSKARKFRVSRESCEDLRGVKPKSMFTHLLTMNANSVFVKMLEDSQQTDLWQFEHIFGVNLVLHCVLVYGWGLILFEVIVYYPFLANLSDFSAFSCSNFGLVLPISMNLWNMQKSVFLDFILRFFFFVKFMRFFIIMKFVRNIHASHAETINFA